MAQPAPWWQGEVLITRSACYVVRMPIRMRNVAGSTGRFVSGRPTSVSARPGRTRVCRSKADHSRLLAGSDYHVTWPMSLVARQRATRFFPSLFTANVYL